MGNDDRPMSARQKAAQARAAAEAAEKRRRLLVNVALGVALTVVVIAIVGGAWWSRRSNTPDPTPLPSPTDVAQPKTAFPSSSPYWGGIPVAGEAAGKPVLQIWEDFQCPACRDFESALGSTVVDLAKSGDAIVIWRTTSFLDRNLPQSNDSSSRAAAAWGCAVDAGKAIEYHGTIFANQPATEGDGWTDDQLREFATTAGITGAAKTTFDQCLSANTYLPWANNGTALMAENNVTGSPTLILNGTQFDLRTTKTVEEFRKAIADAGPPPQ